MTRKIWKPILVGLAIGSAAYFAPFFLFPFFFFFVVAGLLRFLFFRRHGSHYGRFDPVFADAIRSMSAEEYEKFRNRNFGSGACRTNDTTQKA